MSTQSKTGKSSRTRQVASFGAALSTLAVTPFADATLVDLSGNLPGPLAYGFTASTAFNLVGGADLDLLAYNDFIGKTIGTYAGDIAGIRLAAFGSVISQSDTFVNYVPFGTGVTGTRIIGFLTSGGQPGWLKFDLGGAGGAVTYLAAAFEDTQDSIGAGKGLAAAPEPSTTALLGLGLLAMGAAGVSRLRQKRRAGA